MGHIASHRFTGQSQQYHNVNHDRNDVDDDGEDKDDDDEDHKDDCEMMWPSLWKCVSAEVQLPSPPPDSWSYVNKLDPPAFAASSLSILNDNQIHQSDKICPQVRSLWGLGAFLKWLLWRRTCDKQTPYKGQWLLWLKIHHHKYLHTNCSTCFCVYMTQGKNCLVYTFLSP